MGESGPATSLRDTVNQTVKKNRTGWSNRTKVDGPWKFLFRMYPYPKPTLTPC